MPILSVDGTCANFNKKLESAGYGLLPSEGMVSGRITGIYRVDKSDPISVELSSSHNERQGAANFIKSTDKYRNALFVFDRGYYSKQLATMFLQQNIKFLFRLKSNLKIIPKSVVEATENFEAISEDNKIRFIKYFINGNAYYLATSLIDSETFPLDLLKQYYNMRWGVEEYYKYMKHTLRLGDILAKKELVVKKMILCNLIVSKLTYRITGIYSKNIKNKKRTLNKKKLTFGLINSQFIFKMLYNKGDLHRELQIFKTVYIEMQITQIGKSYPRETNNPDKQTYHSTKSKAARAKYEKKKAAKEQAATTVNET